jgi:tRNA pseudouridine55 synthase
MQTPPAVSAKKIAGRPAYELARKSLPVNLAPVKVDIKSLELITFAGNEARIRVHCGSGTYIRSIAHDLGQALGCGAFLKTLRRTASGAFTVDRAHTLEQLAALAEEQRLEEVLLPAASLLPEIPSEIVDDITVAQIRNGRDFRVSPFTLKAGTMLVKAISKQGQLVAVGEAVLPHIFHPLLVI